MVIQCSGYFVYAAGKVQELVMVIGVMGRVISYSKMILRARFTLVIRRPYCPGRPKELCFTTLSLAMETMGMRLSVVKQSFFGPPGQYGRLVTRANYPQIVRQEVLFAINCVNNKMRETLVGHIRFLSIHNQQKVNLCSVKIMYKTYEIYQIKVTEAVNFVHVCFQSAPVNLPRRLTEERNFSALILIG